VTLALSSPAMAALLKGNFDLGTLALSWLDEMGGLVVIRSSPVPASLRRRCGYFPIEANTAARRDHCSSLSTPVPSSDGSGPSWQSCRRRDGQLRPLARSQQSTALLGSELPGPGEQVDTPFYVFSPVQNAWPLPPENI
jgi:hypothetical protein